MNECDVQSSHMSHKLLARAIRNSIWEAEDHSDPQTLHPQPIGEAGWNFFPNGSLAQQTPVNRVGMLLEGAARDAVSALDDALVHSVDAMYRDAKLYMQASQRLTVLRRVARVELRCSRFEHELKLLRNVVAALNGTSPLQLEREFAQLAEEWRAETGHMSSIISLTRHPAYLRIIGMGRAALPFILRDLEQTRSHWFVALKSISGANPVPEQHKGYVGLMIDAWLQWGRAEGII